MANYTTLNYGSSGDEVKKLQEQLINAGYDLGDAGADGQYGDITQAAVRKYQTDSGISASGIADEATLSKLYSANNDQAAASIADGNQSAAQIYAQQASKYGYDPNTDAAYQQAMAALNQAKGEKPIYNSSYEASLNDLYKQITGREDFQYNVSDDTLYQQYKEQYARMGQLSMMDAMGQAAALTGGYSSSYGQAVGQQQYNAYLQQLNEVVPELYGMAYQRYQDEGDALMNQYSMMGQLADDEYNKYLDSLNAYWKNVEYLQGQADDTYNRGLQYAELAYEKRQDAYNNLVDMITQLGYVPTADELEEAGMSQSQFQSYLAYYQKMNPAPVAVSSSGYTGGPARNPTKDDGNGENTIPTDLIWDNYLTAAYADELQEASEKKAQEKKNSTLNNVWTALNNLNRYY